MIGYILPRNKIKYEYPEQVITDYAEFKITRQEATDILKKITCTYDIIKKWDKQLDSAQKLRARDFTCDRNMMVIYVTGAPGSGKSNFGKWFAEKKGYTHTVSAGGDHPFDGYDCEEALLLQDFRASIMKLSDFLKLTDNFHNSQVGARYNNKNFSHCKLILIDSVRDPGELYKAFIEYDEPIAQWYRRIDWKFIKVENGNYNLYYINKDTNEYVFIETLTTVDQVNKDLGIDLHKKANTLEADFNLSQVKIDEAILRKQDENNRVILDDNLEDHTPVRKPYCSW